MTPDTTKSIRLDGTRFKDAQGRTLILRGVNLAGSSKIPTTPNGATHLSAGFFDHRNVSFVGRPFPLEEADEHFERLRTWGLTFLRFLVTWEAVEHAGPGIYDNEYLDYLEAVVEKAAEYDMLLFIDPHQDVWSRFSGGDGAPGWTLELVGFDIANFQETGAALVHQLHGDPFPRMQWAGNYTKLATATMFTLFFGGRDFAPKLTIDGENIQDYLQRHFLGSMQEVARRMVGKEHVIGYDSFNEPSMGFIGKHNLKATETPLLLGATPSPYQAMLLGEGIAQSVTDWQLNTERVRALGRKFIDPDGKRAWMPGRRCIWQEHQVWDFDGTGLPRLMRPDYFHRVKGNEIDFERDYLRPFINRYAESIREIDPEAIIFVEFEAFGKPGVPKWGEDDAQNIVYAPHWYDYVTLMTKRYFRDIGADKVSFRPIFGYRNIRRSFVDQLAYYKKIAVEQFGGVPTIIGETGIPFDLNREHAYRTHDFSVQVEAMDNTLQALDANLLSATLWNYTPDNDNFRGDLWNGEDLSIYSPDQRDDPANIHSGGRALEAVVRPYALATAGQPLFMRYDVPTGVFEYGFNHDDAVDAPTEFFVPNYQYPEGYRVTVSDGEYEQDTENQRLIYWHGGVKKTHTIRVEPLIPREIKKEVRRLGSLLAVLGMMFLVWRVWRWLRQDKQKPDTA